MINKNKENIKRYLKLISTVPESFIDELFDLYGEDTLQTDFIIDINNIARWLSCSKHELTRTLRNTYKQNIDYIVVKQANGVTNSKKYMITPDCFKRLCMMSRSKNAEQVRSYFIELESLIIKYRTQLISGISQDLKKIQRQRKLQKNIINHPGGYTYIIRASKNADKDIFKIGYTSDLVKRLRSYQSGKYEDVEVVFVYKTENCQAVEKCVKGFIDEYRLESKKEIYQLNLNTLKYMMKSCGELGMKLEHRMRGASKKDGQYYAVIARTT